MMTIKAHCNECGGEKNHEIMHDYKIVWDDSPDEEHGVAAAHHYRTLRCLGCDSVRLRRDAWSSDWGNDPTTYYPPALARAEPKWLWGLSHRFSDDDKQFIGAYLIEIYAAVHNDALRLAAIGIRSLLEHLMIHKVGDQGTFGKNLDEFRKAGFLSQTQADYLAKTLEGGHACTHRSWIPSKEELDTLMDVTESIIETVYVLSERLAAVKIPPRLKKP